MTAIELEARPSGRTNNLGLSCTSAGLSLAGVPLLRLTGSGFAPRPAPEIDALMKATGSADVDLPELASTLATVARLLNRGDLGLARAVAAWTWLPELDWDAAARLARADQRLAKYDPDEPRDWHGRWTNGSAARDNRPTRVSHGPANATTSGQGRDRASGRFGIGAIDHRPLRILASSITETDQDETAADEPDGEESARSRFETAYDDLGPTEFADQVSRFGDRLGREGRAYSDAERQDARAEYDFLQDRLSFWLDYEYTPTGAVRNLNSAAMTLYFGAVNGGIVPVGGKGGGLPPSMLSVGGIAAFDNAQHEFPGNGRAPELSDHLIHDIVPERSTEELGALTGLVRDIPKTGPNERFGELGGIVEKEDAGIKWTGGIQDQGLPYEKYYGKQNPRSRELPPGTKTFDHFDEDMRDAVSVKTLNTLTVTNIKSPQKIYGRLKRYVDVVADYKPRAGRKDIPLDDIRTRTIQLAIPLDTSPRQWRQIYRALGYGGSRRVTIVVTRIRER